MDISGKYKQRGLDSAKSSARIVKVVADDRESNSDVIAHLDRMPMMDVTVKRLPVGDYRLDDRFLFERKTLPDLASSIKSGRLFRQTLALVEADIPRPALVLEGTTRDLAGCGISREAVQGALVTVALFMGLPVLRTRCARETANLFLYAARQDRTLSTGALPRRGRRPRGKRALQAHILQGLPGIGPERAARLLERFGSIEAVVAADPTELEAVQGIGQHTSERIRWAVKQEVAPYDVISPHKEQMSDRSLLAFFQCSPWARTDIAITRCRDVERGGNKMYPREGYCRAAQYLPALPLGKRHARLVNALMII